MRNQPGEGAFYGPKLEFILKDREGREWQCGTIQLDLVLPEKLDAEIVTASGGRARPAMLHHAVLGSIERFIAMLLEHHRGQLPFWLAPVQVIVAPVSAAHREYARAVAERLRAAELRCLVDDADETLSRRIVSAHEQGVPIFATAGAKESAADAVTLRRHDGERSVFRLSEATNWLKALEVADD